MIGEIGTRRTSNPKSERPMGMRKMTTNTTERDALLPCPICGTDKFLEMTDAFGKPVWLHTSHGECALCCFVIDNAARWNTRTANASEASAPDEPESYERRIARIGCRCTRPDARCCAGDRGEPGDSCACECHREQDDRRPWDAAPRAAVEGVSDALVQIAHEAFAAKWEHRSPAPSTLGWKRDHESVRAALEAYERARASSPNAAVPHQSVSFKSPRPLGDPGDYTFSNTPPQTLEELREELDTNAAAAVGQAVEPRNLFAPGDEVRHRKGGEYVVLFRADYEPTMQDCYVYRGADGHTWVRPALVMEDGRFELIRRAPPTPRAAYRQPMIEDARNAADMYMAEREKGNPFSVSMLAALNSIGARVPT
jgi:hypothetical protein